MEGRAPSSQHGTHGQLRPGWLPPQRSRSPSIQPVPPGAQDRATWGQRGPSSSQLTPEPGETPKHRLSPAGHPPLFPISSQRSPAKAAAAPLTAACGVLWATQSPRSEGTRILPELRGVALEIARFVVHFSMTVSDF